MNKRFYLLLSVHTLVFVVLALMIPLHYETNDDTVMCWLANGFVTGTPEEHLVFISALYGWCLKILYNIYNGVEWYALLFAIFHVVSITVIVSKIVSSEGSRIIRGSILTLVYALWFVFIVYFQWTTTTALLAVAGICFLHDRSYGKAFVFLFIASLIRFQLVELLGLLYAPVIISRMLDKRDVRELKICGIIVVILFLANFANKLFYQSEEWKDYKHYNNVRGQVHDYPHKARFLAVPPPEGLTRNDIMRTIDFVQDPNIVTAEQLSLMCEMRSSTMEEKVQNILNGFLKTYYQPLLIIVLSLIVTFYTCNDRKSRIAIVSAVILWMAMLCYVVINLQLKQRVFLSTMLLMSLYNIFYIGKETKKVWHGYVMACALILLSAACVNRSVKRVISDRRLAIRLEEQLALIKQVQPHRLLCLKGSFHTSLINPFDMRGILPPKTLMCRGWMTNYPGSSMLKSDLQIVEDSVCIMSLKSEDFESYRISLREHYNTEVEVVEIASSERYKICKLKSLK